MFSTYTMYYISLDLKELAPSGKPSRCVCPVKGLKFGILIRLDSKQKPLMVWKEEKYGLADC